MLAFGRFWHENVNILTNEFMLAITKHFQQRGINPFDKAFFVNDDNAIHGIVENGIQSGLGVPTSYFGPFSVDEAGGYFVHHRIGHTIDLTDRPKTERRTGLDTDAQRFYEFVGDRMVLRYLSTAGIQPVPAEGEAEWGGMITWERLSTGSGQ